jgi:hypothetical protein
MSFSIIEGQSKYYKGAQPKFGYGVKAGINIANQSSHGNDTVTVAKNIIALNAGGYCNYSFNKYVSIQTELMLSGKGSDWEDPYDEMIDLPLYIDIPLLVKYKPVDVINIYAGPQVGCRILATQKDVETGIKSKINDYYNTFEYGLVFGVEANLPNRVNLTIRYVLGLSSATTDVQYIDSWYNNFLQLSVGYRLSGKWNQYVKRSRF